MRARALVGATVGLTLGLAVAAGCSDRRGKHRGHRDAGAKLHAHDLGKLPVDPWAEAPTSDCAKLPFATSIPLAEASGAALVRGPDGPALLVVGDSGTGGAYVELAADDGRVLRTGNLPLGDGAGDDLEGLATTDGARVWGLTSGGFLRAWERDGAGWKLVAGPYPLERHGPCKRDGVNCGHDFEGVCLRPDGRADDAGCIGYAAARADGALYCLVRADEHVALAIPEGHQAAPAGPKVTSHRALADCAIAADGVVWTGDNLLGSGVVRRLAEPRWKGALGDGFPEALALGPGGVVYRFSDTGAAPSLASKYRCPAAVVATGAPVSSAPPIATARDERAASE
jgi:hypothetical protein